MRTLLFFVLFCGSVSLSRAQQNYFVYLQTDNKQPFYVKVNEKIFSSSSAGYVVIPKLTTGSHTLSVGFPKNEWPQQVITLPVANKDQGYILKNFDSKGWGLFNMQSLDVLMANNNAAKPGENGEVATRTDAFSTVLADVVNTPSIKEVNKDEPKEKPVAKPVAAKKEEVVAKAPDPVATPVQPKTEEPVSKPVAPVSADTINQTPTVVPGFVKKISETSTEEGVQLHYLVHEGGWTDTVLVILPIETVATPATVEPIAPAPQKVEEKAAEQKSAPVSQGDPKFIDIELPNPNSPKDTVSKTITEKTVAEVPANVPVKETKAVELKPSAVAPVTQPSGALAMINSDCKSTAGEEDFLKIRKKMVAQKTEDEMIIAAEKVFRQKCFSTEQVRNLSILLLKEESKYKFFDAAYPFVYDTSHFQNLETQLSDPYFVSRFRAMIRK